MNAPSPNTWPSSVKIKANEKDVAAATAEHFQSYGNHDDDVDEVHALASSVANGFLRKVMEAREHKAVP